VEATVRALAMPLIRENLNTAEATGARGALRLHLKRLFCEVETNV
jgi:hypothetical protein